jgi:hypothetical protein
VVNPDGSVLYKLSNGSGKFLGISRIARRIGAT